MTHDCSPTKGRGVPHAFLRCPGITKNLSPCADAILSSTASLLIGAPSGGGPLAERGAALHGRLATTVGEPGRGPPSLPDGRLQGLSRLAPMLPGMIAEPGSEKPPRRASARRPFMRLPRTADQRRPPPLVSPRGEERSDRDERKQSGPKRSRKETYAHHRSHNRGRHGRPRT